MTDLPTGTVTFLFTDLEGSTRLWEQHPEAMRDALARHDEILRRGVEKRGGHVVKTTGDGLHAAFADPADAIGAAVEGQRALLVEHWPLPEPLRVRMGVHSGNAELRGGDYYGPAVNRAARISAAAHGGQIVCSRATADLARDALEPALTLVDLGEHHLRDLGRPEAIVGITGPDLPSEFAPLRTLDAFPGNLPAQVTTFIGRETEIRDVGAALGRAPVVTLTGVGGVGKTRLALHAAAQAVVAYPDGVWLVELAPVDDPGEVAAAVAATLQVKDRLDPVDVIVGTLRRRTTLLVLDNCEHVVDAVAVLVERITQACPDTTVLATSREPLGVDGEVAYAVRPLPVGSSDPASAFESDAVRLFAERAHAATPDFTLDASNVAAVAEICRRLDGIPLAIELAAARVPMLSPAEIVEKLDERFRLLSSGRRTAMARHQTLRNVVDWSHALLDPSEQRLFARLSVFVGGFTLDAVEALSDEGFDDRDVLELLGNLVRRSMVHTVPSAAGTRYEMLETLRLYAAERLAASGGTDAAVEAHCRYFLRLVTDARPHVLGADDRAWITRLRADADNIRAAIAWADDNGDTAALVTFVHALAPAWYIVEGYRDLAHWGLRALAVMPAEPSSVRAEILAWTGIAAHNVEIEPGAALLSDSLHCSELLGEPCVPMAAANLAIVALEATDIDRAVELAERAVAAAEATGDLWPDCEARLFQALVVGLGRDDPAAERIALDAHGRAVAARNEYLRVNATFVAGAVTALRAPAAALPLLDRSVTEMAELRGPASSGHAWFYKGIAHLRLGQTPDAAHALRRALALFAEPAMWFHVGSVLGTVTALLAREDPDVAVRVLAALDSYHRSVELRGAPNDLRAREAVRAALEQHLAADHFRVLWEQGLGMTVREATDLADDTLRRMEVR